MSRLMRTLLTIAMLAGALGLGSPALAQTQILAYVANWGDHTVSVIDTASNTVIATVELVSNPNRIAFTPDGTRAYVTNRRSDIVSVIDTQTHTVAGTVVVGNNPAGVAITPDGTRVYVGNATEQTVSVIDTTTNTVVATISGVGWRPEGMAITPDGTRLYVALRNSNTVKVIDTTTNMVTATVGVGGLPVGVAVTPDGTRAYVTNSAAFSGYNAVSVIDTATNIVVGAIWLSPVPRGVAITPDGASAYVASFFRASNTVPVIDTATNSVIATVPGLNRPNQVAITPDGTRVYVSEFYSASVAVIDTATNTIVTRVGVGNYPYGVAIGTVPLNQPPVADAGPDEIVECTDADRTAVLLDGSGSYDPDGDPLDYEWTFDDGGRVLGEQPTVLLPLGTYSITLTVDDGYGGTDEDDVVKSVEDTIPPEILSLTTAPEVLWPPNHKMRSVQVEVDSSDLCDSGEPVCRIVDVTSSEPENGLGDGDTAPDWVITGDLTLELRAERSGTGDGRSYTLEIACQDASGNSSSATATVTVPHQR